MAFLRVMRYLTLPVIVTCVGSSALASKKYPDHLITIVVPFAAGGPTDILARIIAQSIGPSLGQPVVVEDVTGAGGRIAAAKVARAAPDGYMMVMGNLGTHAAAVGIYRSLPYNPRTDFESVILVASTPMVLVARKTLPVHSISDVVAYAKAHRGKTTMGSAGVGSISHLAFLLFNHLTEAGVVHVPYRGLSEATNDLLGGQIDLLFDQVVTAAPHILASTENPIAVTVPTRAPSIPNVPSVNEAGVPQLQTVAWTALLMSKGTPQPIVLCINAAVQKAMQDPAIQKRIAAIGADIPPPQERTPAALGNLVANEIDKWVPLIEAAGVTPQ